jgi:hypothetical protein
VPINSEFLFFRIGRYIAFSLSLARFPFKMGCLTHYIRYTPSDDRSSFSLCSFLINGMVYRLEIYQKFSLKRREMEGKEAENRKRESEIEF